VEINDVRTKDSIENILIGILKKFIMLVLYFSGINCDLNVDNKGINIPERP